jgi:hypothetical protein
LTVNDVIHSLPNCTLLSSFGNNNQLAGSFQNVSDLLSGSNVVTAFIPTDQAIKNELRRLQAVKNSQNNKGSANTNQSSSVGNLSDDDARNMLNQMANDPQARHVFNALAFYHIVPG